MFCPNCGKNITGTPSFCPDCGARLQDSRYVGFSSKVNDPAFATVKRKNSKAALIFAFIFIPAPAIVTLFIALSKGSWSTFGAGCILSGIFLMFDLFSLAKQKAEKSWDGTVINKEIKRERKRNDKSITYETYYILDIRTDGGKKKKISESEVFHRNFDYFQVGDRLRYHPALNFYYEKYDKSRDEYLYCPMCGTQNHISNDNCAKCGVPVIK